MDGKFTSAVFVIEKSLIRFLEIIITLVFFVIIVLTILLVVLRYVFNTGIIGGNELMEYLFVYITAIGSAIAIGKNEHIRISYFVERFGPLVQLVINLFGTVCVALMHGVFMALSFSWISQVGNSESPVLRIPMSLIQMSVPICCVLSIVFCIFHANVIILKYKKEN